MKLGHFRIEVKVGSRANGSSAAAKLGYIGRTDSKKEDLAFFESGNLPSFAGGDAMKFWKAADAHERKNATLFRESIFSLPVTLPREDHVKIVREYVSSIYPDCPFTFAIHDKDGSNPHCHLMVSERKMDGIDRYEKTFFKRYNNGNPERGGTCKLDIASQGKQWLNDARKHLAIITNRHLSSAGLGVMVSSDSYENMEGLTPLDREQLIARRGRHLGNKVFAKAKKNQHTALVVRLAEDYRKRCYVMRASFTNAAGQQIDYKVAEDHGDRLLLANNASKKSCLIVMQEAAKRWPEGCEIFGDAETRMKLAAAAAVAGVRVTNLTNKELVEYQRIQIAMKGKRDGRPDIRIQSARPGTASPKTASAGRFTAGVPASHIPVREFAAKPGWEIRKRNPNDPQNAASLLEDYRTAKRLGAEVLELDRVALNMGYPLLNIINAHAVGYGVPHHAAAQEISRAFPDVSSKIKLEKEKDSRQQCIDPAEPAQLKPLKHKPQQAFSFSAIDAVADCCRT